MNIAYNMDCMEYMRTLPDKAFDLAVVDPPYGSGDSQFVHVERERKTDPRQKNTGSGSAEFSTNTDRVQRTGGGWAMKYGKKSSRGTLPLGRTISGSWPVSHAIKLSGAETISAWPGQGAF